MYTLHTPLKLVKGIGEATAEKVAKLGFNTVQDFLLFLPLHYEDRSHFSTINQLEIDKLVTLKARVISTNNRYQGHRSTQYATVEDRTGRLKLMWFNNRFIIQKLRKGEEYLISGT